MGLLTGRSGSSIDLPLSSPFKMGIAVLGRRGLIQLLGLGLIVVFASLLQLAQPMLLSRIISPDSSQRTGAAELFAIAVISHILLSIAGQIFQQMFQLRKSSALREEVFSKINSSQVGSSLEAVKPLYPVISVVEIPNAVNGVVRPVIQGARDLTLIGGVVVYFLGLSEPLIFVAICMLLLGCFSITRGLGPIKRDGATAVAANQDFSHNQYEYISHYDEVRSRAGSRTAAAASGVNQSIGRLYERSKRLLLTKSKYGAFAEFFFGLTAPAMACVAAVVLYPRGELQLSQILEVFLYSSMIVGPVQSAAGASFDWQYTSTLVGRILRLQNLSQENLDHFKELDAVDRGCIRVVDLEKRDALRDDELLRSTSFEVPPCGILAISGHSGTGKTTLGRILAGLDVPSRGSVLDENGLELDPRALRERFGYAAQNPGFAEGLFESAVTASQDHQIPIVDSISALKLTHLIPRLEGRSFFGSDFSGGEAKRLSIFGAISQEKPGVILDEPTNGLNDQLVEQFLCYLNEYRYDRTWILITHDKRVKDMADQLVELSTHG